MREDEFLSRQKENVARHLRNVTKQKENVTRQKACVTGYSDFLTLIDKDRSAWGAVGVEWCDL